MVGSDRQGPSGIAIASLVASTVCLLLLSGGAVLFHKRTTAMQAEAKAQADAALVESKSSAQAIRGRLDEIGKSVEDLGRTVSALEIPPPASSPVAESERILGLIETSLPTVTDKIVVRRKPENAGFEFTFTLTNTSGVVLECSTPEVEMTHNDYPPSEENPNLATDEGAADVGRLAPGANYSTIWSTKELTQVTWMQFSGACHPLAPRQAELLRLTKEAGIPFDHALLMASYGGWTSTDTAR